MSSKNNHCLICQRIAQIKQGKNSNLIREFATGYAVLGDYQYFSGYSVLLCKLHKTELHQLNKRFKLKSLEEMSILAQAIYKTFKPSRLNYELLGNTDHHLHWHIFPRYKKELKPNAPVWATAKRVRLAKKYLLEEEDKKVFINKINKNINFLLNKK